MTIAYSDRLTITSYGGLVPGLSKEEFFSGRSMIRNRELMRVYRDLDLVEQLGSGMNRILNVYPRDIFYFSDNFMEVCFVFEEEYLSTGQGIGQVTGQGTGQVKALIDVMKAGEEYTRAELMKRLSLKHRETFYADYLKPALNDAFVEMTIPDKPKSQNQKYRLCRRG